MCEKSEDLRKKKNEKVNTMLDDLKKVVNSAGNWTKQKRIMETMMTKADNDEAKKKKCAQYIMNLVKNYRIKGSNNKENPTAMCIKEMNDNIVKYNEEINQIYKEIYQKYIDSEENLKTFLETMTKSTTADEIPGIVKAMENQIKAIDTEDSKAAGKTYRKDQRMKSRGNSEAGSEEEDEPLTSRDSSEAGSEAEDEYSAGLHSDRSSQNRKQTPRSRGGSK
jgi:hypothetical protein